ncbi:ran-binding protein 9-like isoform X1 [Varroa jacobsoni]|uniref:ran-binding protein 9-like isoform X1 n=1 Tax=Varroa jacobsoni TaxID=62625 RepID=UPI000BF44A47|nr:ran-binding protein 9-like isoform X1 [Varroa jacobsoni]XP_022691545.1 ran-binding protein 9-like isoform X1 [Varroa jacobsoni]
MPSESTWATDSICGCGADRRPAASTTRDATTEPTSAAVGRSGVDNIHPAVAVVEAEAAAEVANVVLGVVSTTSTVVAVTSSTTNAIVTDTTSSAPSPAAVVVDVDENRDPASSLVEIESSSYHQAGSDFVTTSEGVPAAFVSSSTNFAATFAFANASFDVAAPATSAVTDSTVAVVVTTTTTTTTTAAAATTGITGTIDTAISKMENPTAHQTAEMFEALKGGDERLRLLYPAVDESETPLPRQWSPKDKFTYIGLSLHNLRVHYKGTGKNHKDAASVRATHPIPAACGIYYFEVKIVSKGRDGDSVYMGVGLSAHGVNMNRLPGWDKQSYGYHGDDGHSFCSSGTGQPYGPTFSTGDVIGCGVNLLDNTCFYTKNGVNLGVAFQNLPANLYPTVGLQTPGEVIDANFGQLPFVFDIESVIHEARARTRVQIETFPVADSQGEFQTTLHSLVLSFLMHHGYLSTAESFAKATDQTIDEPLESIRNRQRVRQLVLAGRIEEAINMTRQLYPGLLDSRKPCLRFQLMCRQFVEMVADLSENGRDNRNQNSGDALDLEEGAERMDIEENPRYASALPVVFPATALRDSDTRPPVTLEKIIEFGKELYELEKSLKDPDGKYKQMLFDACALLAYSDPTQSPVAYLLCPSEREPVSAVLNSAILELLGDKRPPPLETSLNHCKRLIKLMAQSGLGASAFADVDSTLN